MPAAVLAVIKALKARRVFRFPVNGADSRIRGIRGLGERPWLDESLPVIRSALL